jgi:hypothetical protein
MKFNEVVAEHIKYPFFTDNPSQSPMGNFIRGYRDVRIRYGRKDDLAESRHARAADHSWSRVDKIYENVLNKPYVALTPYNKGLMAARSMEALDRVILQDYGFCAYENAVKVAHRCGNIATSHAFGKLANDALEKMRKDKPDDYRKALDCQVIEK